MVLRCKECGEVIEVHTTDAQRTEAGKQGRRHIKADAPRCPDCAAWAWELCQEGDEAGGAV